MIQKQTVLKPCSTTPILKVKVFHIYSKRSHVAVSEFTKNSIKMALKKNSKVIGKKIFSVFIKQRSVFKKKDASSIFFLENQAVLYKKKKKLIGGFMVGPCSYNISFLKIKSKFSKLI